MSEPAIKECIPCKGGLPPLKGHAPTILPEQPGRGWDLVDEHHLTRTFRLESFAEALARVNRVGQMAEEQNHHADIYPPWGKAPIDIPTHKIDGLTGTYFVFAAKAEKLL